MTDASLGSLCRARTALSPKDIALLQGYEYTLQSAADLTRADVFVDCMGRDGRVFVAAQASPQYDASRYHGRIQGMLAMRVDEPAVYLCFESGLPSHDTLANTQENRTVSQSVVPIKNGAGNVIGVLISESDISHIVQMERKLQALDRNDWQPPAVRETTCGGNCVWIRESHHRTKNCLQIISSICGIKAREAPAEDVRDAYRECAGLTAAVARLHERVSPGIRSDEDVVDLAELLNLQMADLRALVGPTGSIAIRLNCDPVRISRKKALTIAVLVNELVMNAAEHAFSGDGGAICVEVTIGSGTVIVSVSDNGRGLGERTTFRGGLSLADALVRGQLDGELNIGSGEKGTTVSFSCNL